MLISLECGQSAKHRNRAIPLVSPVEGESTRDYFVRILQQARFQGMRYFVMSYEGRDLDQALDVIIPAADVAVTLVLADRTVTPFARSLAREIERRYKPEIKEEKPYGYGDMRFQSGELVSDVTDTSSGRILFELLHPVEIKYALEQKEESFSEALFQIIRDKGMDEVDCYKRAGIDRKLFSQIRTDHEYHPRKDTALALAVALRLDSLECDDLLETAGYTLSSSSSRDIIVSWCLDHQVWDIMMVNEALDQFGQDPLTNMSF